MALPLEQQKEFRQKIILTKRELVERLANIWNEIEFETEKEIDEFLREQGYDPDEIGAKMNRIATLLIEKQERDLCHTK